MALITSIQRSRRIIRCHKRTAMEVNFDERLFSIWTAAAGAECGSSLSAANIQLDREQALRLKELLNEFLAQSAQNT